MHTIQGLVKIKGHKLWLDISKVLSIIHAIVELVLEPVEITDSPLDLVPKTLPLLIVLMLLKFLSDIHPLDIELKRTELITHVKNIQQGI